jgi:hypothetical protein
MRKQSSTPCSVEGCDHASLTRGWCPTHYSRWYKHGDPLFTSRRDIPTGSFEELTDKDGPVPAHVPEIGCCWTWRGAHFSIGYGVFVAPSGERVSAHRWALRQATAQTGAGLLACHKCDNPLCVRPSHLFWGTTADNVADKIAKGRQPRGVRQWRAKLTDDIVRSIRDEVRNGTKQAELARKYEVSTSVVSEAVSGKTWSHVV